MINLEPWEAAEYHDRFAKQSVRPIRHYLWKLNEADIDEEWPDPIEVIEVTRDALTNLTLRPNERLHTEPGVFIIGQNKKDMVNVLVLTHSFYRSDEGAISWESRSDAWFDDPEDVDRLISELEAAKSKVWH